MSLGCPLRGSCRGEAETEGVSFHSSCCLARILIARSAARALREVTKSKHHRNISDTPSVTCIARDTLLTRVVPRVRSAFARAYAQTPRKFCAKDYQSLARYAKFFLKGWARIKTRPGRVASNNRADWQVVTCARGARTSNQGLCPKMKYPAFYAGIIVCFSRR